MLSEKSKEHMLGYIPTREAYGRTKAAGRTGKGYTRLSIIEKRPGRWSQADTDACARRGCHSFQRPYSTHPAECLMQSRHLVNVCLLLMKIENNSSHVLTIRKSHQGIWRGRQRALATHMVKMETRPPRKSKQKLQKKQKVRSPKPVLLHSSLCTVHSVLTLGIACKIIH